MSYSISTNNVLTFSGTNGALEYVAFWQDAGRPAELEKNKAFVYQGFLVKYLPMI